MSQDSGNPLATVRLKNGEEVPDVVVKVLMISLTKLIGSNPIAFYELVMACRNPAEHILFGNTSEMLVQMNLIESVDEAGRARIHDTTRSIVLSASEGGEHDMRLVSPRAAG
jgi:hypothetical protein